MSDKHCSMPDENFQFLKGYRRYSKRVDWRDFVVALSTTAVVFVCCVIAYDLLNMLVDLYQQQQIMSASQALLR